MRLLQPTFLYESLWDIDLGVALIYIGRRVKLGRRNGSRLRDGLTRSARLDRGTGEDHANHIQSGPPQRLDALLVFLGGAVLVLPIHTATPRRFAIHGQTQFPRTGRADKETRPGIRGHRGPRATRRTREAMVETRAQAEHQDRDGRRSGMTSRVGHVHGQSATAT